MADDKQLENVRRAIGFFRDENLDYDEILQRQFGELVRDIKRLQAGNGTYDDAVNLGLTASANFQELLAGMVPVVQVLVALRTHETGASAEETWDRVQALIESRDDQQ
ncbi:hypothetical protein [Gordonia sp. HS-NH1]|uniref:hypothetical protein n=1 Tax=Gordonia sp. HS-NH1 TaxID=1435068 RepID=UPI0006E30B99|nr:hypothetical protein [Gordonia sp. HS-NH1]